MIIVSQLETMIFNLNKLTALGVSSLEDKSVAVKAYYNFESTKGITLGRYKDVTRAKEVLQEIITRYKNWENMKAGQPSGLCLPVYEMPKE